MLLLIWNVSWSPLYAQEEDEFEEFDISMFEEAGESLTAFCTNKVLSQSPTSLISFGYDVQGPSTLTPQAIGNYYSDPRSISINQGFRFISNIPVVSKNNILINWGINYVQMGYFFENDQLTNPLVDNLDRYSLKWFNTNVTLFKPLNERKFLLFQLSGELNGDYSFSNMPSLNQLRVPAAFIYGWKPDDRTMWGPGISRTYLGGSLNLLPVIYYYKTFKNENWGIEALFPARVQARYRWNSRSLMMFGYQVEGATYRLSNFNEIDGTLQALNPDDNVELRRSEIRLGLTFNKGLNDFIWVGIQGGYRINYLFNTDQGDFFRGFDDSGYFMENELTNTYYLQVSVSLVSP
jgi:hypothetical protein